MLQLTFTDSEVAELAYERYHHPSPQVQRRMEVLYLKAKNLPHQEIRRLCGISKTTLVSYLRTYQAGGIAALKEQHYVGSPSLLNAHSASLEAYFREHPPHSLAEARAVIAERTGITRSPTQVRAFLRRLGMRVRKTAVVPGRATDPAKQAEQQRFQEAELEPRLEEVRTGRRTLFVSTPRTSSTELFSAGSGVSHACSSPHLQGAID